MKTKECEQCAGCPLVRLFPEATVVPVKPGTSLRIAIGEMPSDEDVRVGSPFSDGVGRILDMLLRKAGIRRDEVTMLNVIQCHPLDDKFPADVKAVHHCIRNHVLPVLHSKPWVRLDLIGEKALKFIGLQEGIARWRGSPIDVNVDDLEQKYTH